MDALLYLLLILFLSKIFGEGFERVGFPSILGELLAGMVTGLLLFSDQPEFISFFADMGAIFLLFTAGYKEVHLQDLKASSAKASIATLVQISIAFISGFLLASFYGYGLMISIFLGVAFSPTSIGVVVRTLIDMDQLSSRPGSMMLTSAIFDDILGIFLLSVVVTMARYDQFPSLLEIGLILFKILFFIALMLMLGKFLFSWLFEQVHRMQIKESIFGFVIIVALFSSYLAEVFGLHAVIGAFIGGVMLSDIPLAKIEPVQSKVTGLSYGLFVPIFFAFIGLSLDFSVLKDAGSFAALVMIVALLGKFLGGFIGGKLIGFDRYDSLIFGTGMMPRAGVELVLISIGREMGIIDGEIFAAVVMMVVASIFISPVLLKFMIELKVRSISINT